MHKIMNVALVLLILSSHKSLASCKPNVTMFNIKQMTQNPPRENRIIQDLKASDLYRISLGFYYVEISSIEKRTDTKDVRVNSCSSYYKMSLNQQQYECIKKNIKEKRDFYIEAQKAECQNRKWFKIQHAGITDYTRPLK